MFASAFLSVIGLGFLVWVLFALAVYALPAFVGVSVGMYVYDTEAGVIAALVAGMFAAVFTYLIGQLVFAKVQSVPIRLAIGALFAAPAGVAGFSAIKGLSQIGGASEGWTLAFAVVGGIVTAGTAWVRSQASLAPSARTMCSTQMLFRRVRSRTIAETTPPTTTQHHGMERGTLKL